MQEIIPKLNCKWNDVVQFSALDPQIIVRKLKEIHPELKLMRVEYFKIPDVQIVPQYEALISTKNTARLRGDYSIQENEVEWLNANFYEELTEVPISTINYWLDVKINGGKFLWFPYVPHVFSKA